MDVDSAEIATFVAAEELAGERVATGIGVGGGALTGRVAQKAEDIERLRREYPGEAILLLRPDTVPDDIPLLIEADGLLTAIGGATSHAAVVAKRLGKTAVVGCRLLRVFEPDGVIQLAGQPVAVGDFLSINGRDGSVYLGKHATTVTDRRGGRR